MIWRPPARNPPLLGDICAQQDQQVSLLTGVAADAVAQQPAHIYVVAMPADPLLAAQRATRSGAPGCSFPGMRSIRGSTLLESEDARILAGSFFRFQLTSM